MSCILHIETSTNVCSVALSEDGKLLYHQEDFDGPGHSETSGVYVDEALSFANLSLLMRLLLAWDLAAIRV